MAKRSRVNAYKDKRIFTKTARRTHKANYGSLAMRGGLMK